MIEIGVDCGHQMVKAHAVESVDSALQCSHTHVMCYGPMLLIALTE